MKKIVGGIAIAAILVFAILSKKNTPVSNEKIQVSFTSYINEVRGVKRIQLAELNSFEVIERTSEFSFFWNTLKLPDVVVQARIPTQYIYYVDLADPLKIEINGENLVVHAKLKAGEPAPNISAIAYEVKQGSLFRNKETAFEELRKTITPLLKQSAENKKQLVKVEAAKQFEEIIKQWSLQSADLKDVIKTIHVNFDEDIPVEQSK